MIRFLHRESWAAGNFRQKESVVTGKMFSYACISELVDLRFLFPCIILSNIAGVNSGSYIHECSSHYDAGFVCDNHFLCFKDAVVATKPQRSLVWLSGMFLAFGLAVHPASRKVG
ncbi:uncharacterized protein LAJ45_01812 [Morchella importuna]|uniref:uncharacterized protein n=1 Tax=Morchella importuna TaxID=1174673 RepID=UPI001E8E37FE|nr:uncharacterized protein LAJ45_01812 [Morchella importuna]KAH8154045.1 hypothetical protein LAJ45_01812 [Morchella importuna]